MERLSALQTLCDFFDPTITGDDSFSDNAFEVAEITYACLRQQVDGLPQLWAALIPEQHERFIQTILTTPSPKEISFLERHFLELSRDGKLAVAEALLESPQLSRALQEQLIDFLEAKNRQLGIRINGQFRENQD